MHSKLALADLDDPDKFMKSSPEEDYIIHELKIVVISYPVSIKRLLAFGRESSLDLQRLTNLNLPDQHEVYIRYAGCLFPLRSR